MEHKVQAVRRLALSRRGFLLGTAGLTATALFGCGGGGNGSSGDEFNGTFRGRDPGSSGVAASLSVDRDGFLTYWTLFVDGNLGDGANDSAADFGQAALGLDNRFTATAQGVTTTGEFVDNRVTGRTQDAANGAIGYNWFADRVGDPGRDGPPRELIGNFEGIARLTQNFEMTVLLGVSPDGNATFLGFTDNVNTPAEGSYNFESLSFDDRGEGYDYFLDLFADRIDLDLDRNGLPVLVYTFANDPDLEDELRGRTFDIPLDRIDRSRAPGRAMSRLRAAGAGRSSSGQPFRPLKRLARGQKRVF